MAIVWDAPVNPVALTTFIREVPKPLDLTLTNLFPVRPTARNEVNVLEVTRINRTARFRPFDGQINVSGRNSATSTTVQLPPLSSSTPPVGEYERLKLEFARTGGTAQEALAEAIYSDGEQLVREIWARVEQAWGDLLSDGKVTINEGGLQSEADFGVPAGHKVTAGTAWTSVSTALALTDIRNWADVWTATNGSRPGQIRTSLAVTRLIQRNAEVIAACYGTAAGRTLARLSDVNDMLRDENLPLLADSYDAQVDVDGTTTRTIADDLLLMTPADPAQLGHLAFGVTATSLELVNSNEVDFGFEEAPGIVGVVDKVGPPYREFTFVDAVALPVLDAPKRLLVADVK